MFQNDYIYNDVYGTFLFLNSCESGKLKLIFVHLCEENISIKI